MFAIFIKLTIPILNKPWQKIRTSYIRMGLLQFGANLIKSLNKASAGEL